MMNPMSIRLLLSLLCFLATPAMLWAAESMEVRALLVPAQEAVLSSQIEGRITGLPLEAGDRFAKGDLLVELECEILKAELQKARTDLDAAVETNNAKLRLKEYGSASDLEVAISSARQKRAQAEVLLAETKVKMCVIRAPFAGRIVKRKANPYENITPENPILEILDDKLLKMHLLVPSTWLQWLAVGRKFTVRIDETGKEYEAAVTGLGARVNPVNQTLEVEAAFVKSHAELLAGMSGSARFSLPSSNTGGR